MRVCLDAPDIIEVATASPMYYVQGAVFCCLKFNPFGGWFVSPEQRQRWIASLRLGQQRRREREERQQSERSRQMRMNALAMFAAQPLADPELEARIALLTNHDT